MCWGGILFNGYGFYAASFICIQYTNIRRLFYKHDTNKALLLLLDSKNLHPGPKHTKTHTHTELAAIITERRRGSSNTFHSDPYNTCVQNPVLKFPPYVCPLAGRHVFKASFAYAGAIFPHGLASLARKHRPLMFFLPNPLPTEDQSIRILIVV